jgi:CRISPR/Cas system-associated endoribonuclease Cas2
VFIVDARPAKLLRLRAELADLINQGSDSILFCDLGTLREHRNRLLDVIGCSRRITDHGPAIL